MYTKQPKKVSLFNTLEILQKYSDENHRLSQKDIMDILRKEYDMVIDRKTVKRNLMELMDLGFEIEYIEKERNIKDKMGEKSIVYTDFYLVRDFTDSELRLIIDSILVSNHIPDKQRKDLVKKLSKLSNVYFKQINTEVKNVNIITSQNKEFFLNIEIIDEAILNGKKVEFSYNEYKINKKLHAVINRVIEKPSEIITFDGHYYMVCNSEQGCIYRIDKITNIKLIEHKDIISTNEIDVCEHRVENFIFKDDKKIYVKFSVLPKAVEKVVDAYHWSLLNGKYVKIISPSDLINEVRYTTEELSHSYSIGGQYRLNKALFDYKKNKRLDLTGVNLRDLNVISEVTEPVEVVLKMNFINNFSFLEKYQNLASLRIVNQKVDDFSFLYSLESLKYLRLSGTGFDDLKFIENCKGLRKLYLLENDFENIEILYQLTKLEFLQINHSMAEKIDVKRLKDNNPDIQVVFWTQSVVM